MSNPVTFEHLDQHIPNKLRNRVRIYLILSLLIFAVIVFRLFQDKGNAVYSLSTFALGLIVGIFVSRMYKISWDKNAEKVVSRLDTYGGILLGLYIVFEITGEYIIHHLFIGPAILTMVLSLAGGALLGRGLGMGKMMVRVIAKNI